VGLSSTSDSSPPPIFRNGLHPHLPVLPFAKIRTKFFLLKTAPIKVEPTKNESEKFPVDVDNKLPNAF